jgi:hypothetical protein
VGVYPFSIDHVGSRVVYMWRGGALAFRRANTDGHTRVLSHTHQHTLVATHSITPDGRARLCGVVWLLIGDFGHGATVMEVIIFNVALFGSAIIAGLLVPYSVTLSLCWVFLLLAGLIFADVNIVAFCAGTFLSLILALGDKYGRFDDRNNERETDKNV